MEKGSLEDDSRSGSPQSTYSAEKIERVSAIIEEDPHATHYIIEAVTSIIHFTINQIIHNALKKKTSITLDTSRINRSKS